VEIPQSQGSKEVMNCKILEHEWVTMWTGQAAEMKAKKCGENYKQLKNWGAKNTRGQNLRE
jgi:hypothetical protein